MTRDRIYREIHQLVAARLATWQAQRKELLDSVANADARVAELDEMIAEAVKELAIAEQKAEGGR